MFLLCVLKGRGCWVHLERLTSGNCLPLKGWGLGLAPLAAISNRGVQMQVSGWAGSTRCHVVLSFLPPLSWLWQMRPS